MVPLAEVKIRGTALAPVEGFVRGRLGDESWGELLGAMPQELADVFRAGPHVMSWYPFEHSVAFLPELVRIAGRESVLRDLAHATLDYSTRHIFKAIFKLGSPGFMVARSDLVWRRYYSTGRMKVDVERGSARVEVRDFPPLPALYDRVVLHSVEAVIEKAGGRITHAEVVAAGDARLALAYAWS